MTSADQDVLNALALGDVSDGSQNLHLIGGTDRVQSGLHRELTSIFAKPVKIAPRPHRPCHGFREKLAELAEMLPHEIVRAPTSQPVGPVALPSCNQKLSPSGNSPSRSYRRAQP